MSSNKKTDFNFKWSYFIQQCFLFFSKKRIIVDTKDNTEAIKSRYQPYRGVTIFVKTGVYK